MVIYILLEAVINEQQDKPIYNTSSDSVEGTQDAKNSQSSHYIEGERIQFRVKVKMDGYTMLDQTMIDCNLKGKDGKRN